MRLISLNSEWKTERVAEINAFSPLCVFNLAMEIYLRVKVYNFPLAFFFVCVGEEIIGEELCVVSYFKFKYRVFGC